MLEKMSKIEIVMNPDKFEDLKEAMNGIGVTGMTVTNALGCGLQKGHKEFYRGVPVEINLKQKLKVEIVVCEVPVETVIQTALRMMRSNVSPDARVSANLGRLS